MNSHDIYLLSPEISVAGLAIIVLLLDLVISRKGYLTIIAALGLTVPLGFSLSLWVVGLDGATSVSNDGILATTLSVDKFSLFFKFLLLAMTAVILMVSSEYVRRFARFQGEYYALILFALSGMMLLSSATELITLFIALELTALPIAALAAFLRDGKSSESGLKFLILSGVSSALLLYGMVLVYGFTGTTVLSEIAKSISEITMVGDEPFGSYALALGSILMIAGFGFKITAFPFQMWAPDVYEGAPTPVTAFLSVASKAAGFSVVLRVFYVAFPLDAISVEWSAVFAILAALSMSIGNLVAISQGNIKRMLAYSTVAHAGYIMVGLATATSRTAGDEPAFGPSGVLFYLSGYAVMNLAAFSAVIAISSHIDSDKIQDYAGMGRRAPFPAAVLAFAMISLTGVPPTVGFMAKVYIFGSAVNSDLAWLAVLGGINSVVSAYYYVRVIKVMYLSDPASVGPVSSGMATRLAMVVTVSGVLFFGLYPRPLLEFARTAAEVLF